LARLCDAGPLVVAFYRVFFTTVLLIPFATGRSSPSQGSTGGRERRRTALLTALSGLCLALHFATWIGSLYYTSVGASVFLLATQPLFALILSRIFLGEVAGRRTVAAVGVTLAGTAWIAWGDLGLEGNSWFGDLLSLTGAFFAAAYLLIGRSLRSRVHLGRYLVGAYGLGTVVLAALVAVSGGPWAGSLAGDWPWLVLMAAGPGVAGHGLLNWTVRRIRSYVVHAALLGEPVLATLYAWLVFRESPGAHVATGGVLIVAGLAWVFREEGREEAAEPGHSL
jgi:drug/metabolite transporter (DMT)-like permease